MISTRFLSVVCALVGLALVALFLVLGAADPDALQHAARPEPAREPAENEDDEQRPARRAADHDAQPLALLDIAPDQQAEAGRQHEDAHDRPARAVHGLAGAGIFDLRLARPVECAGRQRLDIAGDALADRRGDEIERGTGRARTALHDIDEAPDA